MRIPAGWSFLYASSGILKVEGGTERGVLNYFWKARLLLVLGTSLAVQWLGLCGSKQGAQVQFPGQGIRILHTVHEPGLRQQIKKNLKVSSKKLLRNMKLWTSLLVQWLGLWDSTARSQGLTPSPRINNPHTVLCGHTLKKKKCKHNLKKIFKKYWKLITI